MKKASITFEPLWELSIVFLVYYCLIYLVASSGVDGTFLLAFYLHFSMIYAWTRGFSY